MGWRKLTASGPGEPREAMGSPAVSRFLYKGEYSEQNTKVKRIFGEEISDRGIPPMFLLSVCNLLRGKMVARIQKMGVRKMRVL